MSAETAALPAWVFQRGEVLGGTYRVIRRLAVGGMGEVYLCRHARLPGFFVIKVLAKEFQNSTESVVRFRREAEIMASLRHPNIVQVFDFNVTAERQPFLVMEYLEGHDLATVLEPRRPMSRLQVVNIIRQVASALQAAHDAGIVHRDLKPENVVLIRAPGQENFVKVIDFGISLSPGTSRITANEVLMGTPHFMSPEQAQGRRAAVDPRSDEFSLATMAYLMLTGRVPFGGDEPLTVLYNVVNKTPEPLPAYLGPEANRVLMRALSKRQAERYDSVMDFASALEAAIVEGSEPLVGPRSSPSQAFDLTERQNEIETAAIHMPRTKQQRLRRSRRLAVWNAFGTAMLSMSVGGLASFVLLEHYTFDLSFLGEGLASVSRVLATWATELW